MKLLKTTSYSVQELRARIDEADAILFVVNSGVSKYAVRTGILERIKGWEIELAATVQPSQTGSQERKP